jgi:hypothetical protein
MGCPIFRSTAIKNGTKLVLGQGEEKLVDLRRARPAPVDAVATGDWHGSCFMPENGRRDAAPPSPYRKSNQGTIQ